MEMCNGTQSIKVLNASPHTDLQLCDLSGVYRLLIMWWVWQTVEFGAVMTSIIWKYWIIRLLCSVLVFNKPLNRFLIKTGSPGLYSLNNTAYLFHFNLCLAGLLCFSFLLFIFFFVWDPRLHNILPTSQSLSNYVHIQTLNLSNPCSNSWMHLMTLEFKPCKHLNVSIGLYLHVYML